MATIQTLPADHVWTGAEMQELLDTHIRYKNWKLIVEEEYVQRNGIVDIDLHVRAEWEAPDSLTGKMEKQQSRWWRLSKHMRKNEIISSVFACIKMAEEHEMRESFLYRLGNDWTMPYNTHTDVDVLAAASEKIDVRIDTRPTAPANQRRD